MKNPNRRIRAILEKCLRMAAVAAVLFPAASVPGQTAVVRETVPVRETRGTFSVFPHLIGPTGWQVNLKNFTLSLRQDRYRFSLGVSDHAFLRFSGEDESGARFGVLQTAHVPALNRLLNCALIYSGKSREQMVSMRLDWAHYPDSVAGWAAVWDGSRLKQDWNGTGPYARYDALVRMIASAVTRDFQPVAEAMGFTITGASMEKMTGRSPPVPLMLWLTLASAGKNGRQSGGRDGCDAVSIDTLFVTARQKDVTVYCTYKRVFDEFGITGDRISDGTFESIRPLTDPECHPAARILLDAAFSSAGVRDDERISLRLDLKLYPELFEDAVRWMNENPGKIRASSISRSGMPARAFVGYLPANRTGFAAALDPLISPMGLRFDGFELGVDLQKLSAGPDIVYLILKK